ncbi:MAG: macro domain-containing protein [Planctomycetaceae bacterium]|nr:macro domain-containing protein [Planctomycetaceae bacterium]
MRKQIGSCLLELDVGDISLEQTDAIVNAANSALAGGGGVDGAIHRAAGPLPMQQTRERYPEGCPAGHAVVTDAGRLSARYIFHAVGPIWQGGRFQEADLLRSVYSECLRLARELNCQSIAFPAISTGAYGYPLDLATETALLQIIEDLRTWQQPAHVRCICFHEGILGAYGRVLERLIP